MPVLPCLVSHCSVKTGQFLSHCNQRTIRWHGTVPEISSPSVVERRKCDSNRSQGPCSTSSPSIMADVLATWWMTPKYWPWWVSLCHISNRISHCSGSTYHQIGAISCDCSRGKTNISVKCCLYFWARSSCYLIVQPLNGMGNFRKEKKNQCYQGMLVALWVFLLTKLLLRE